MRNILSSILFSIYSSSSVAKMIDNVDITEDFIWEHFKSFEERFQKKYENFEVMHERFDIFKTNLLEIQRHNSDKSQNFTKGINQFTDLTPDEFNKKYLGKILNERNVVGLYGCGSFSTNQDSNSFPEEVDWRKEGVVTPVKDQGQCGSCWTFSATGAMEGSWAISTGKLESLSEEELADCALGYKYGSHGCNGGQMDGAFKYAIENGATSESQYPYTAGKGKTGECKEEKVTDVATFSDCYDVKANDQVSLKAAVSKQPIAIAIEADTRYFQSYSSGILTSSDCGTNLDHGVLIVGYGEEKGQKYWLVKNSWSTSWGDEGYVKIARSESRNDKGICGIAMQPSFITV